MSAMVVIVDYGIGNVGSIRNMLKKIGVEAVITSKVDDIKHAEKIILPGVGAFDNAMANLRKFNLIPVLEDKVLNQGTPILGICLGMQLFAQKSEEGGSLGLGWIDGIVRKFNFDGKEAALRIPHMGWNEVRINPKSRMLDNMYDDARFYFIHSYHIDLKNEDAVSSQTFYGYDFVSTFEYENIIGVQFHPEKSHKYGMKLLENFVRLF